MAPPMAPDAIPLQLQPPATISSSERSLTACIAITDCIVHLHRVRRVNGGVAPTIDATLLSLPGSHLGTRLPGTMRTIGRGRRQSPSVAIRKSAPSSVPSSHSPKPLAGDDSGRRRGRHQLHVVLLPAL